MSDTATTVAGSASPRALAAGIVARLRAAGHQALFAGGCVRDLLLGNEPGDYDIATSATPEEVQALFARTVPVGAAFGVVLVMPDGPTPFEVATFRRDLAYSDHRRPDGVVYSDARADASRRDFTINGLFLDPETDEILDYVGGRADLEGGVIRAIGDPDLRIAEDRLRMLRAIRLAARLQFQIDNRTFAAVKRHAATVIEVSAERIRDELVKMLRDGDPAAAIELLEESGLLAAILPEVAALRAGDSLDRTLMVLTRMQRPAPVALGLGALLHAVPLTAAMEVAARLRLATAERDRILALVGGQERFEEVPAMSLAALKRFLRQPDFDAHLELHRLTRLAGGGDLAIHALCGQRLAEFGRDGLSPPPFVGGQDLIALGLKPGPKFARILTELEDAQLAGEVTSRAEALALLAERYAPR